MEPGRDHTMTRRLALLEVFGRDGRLLHRVDVQRWPLSLGRALDNDVVLDDPFVAAHHATLHADADGQLLLQVDQTTNGVVLDRRHHATGARVPLPATAGALQMGGSKLLLRLPGEVLAPERPLPASVGPGWLTAPRAAALVLPLAVADHWLGLDPGADSNAWLPLVVGLPAILALWCMLWALVSKLFQQRFDLAGHVRIALPWLLAIGVADALLPALAASLAWPGLWRLLAPLQLLLLLLMLRSHLHLVLPSGGRKLTVVLVTMALSGGAIVLSLTHHATDRFSRPAYMSTLPVAALPMARPVPIDDLLQGLAPLAGQLAARVKKALEDEPGEGDAAGE